MGMEAAGRRVAQMAEGIADLSFGIGTVTMDLNWLLG
jgi:hypothetical protein